MFIGIDVSKTKLDCVWIRDLATLKIKSKVLPNTPQGHRDLVAWALQQGGEPVEQLHFVMEATGVYHEALAYALHDAGARVFVLNPARVRDFARSLGSHSKNDSKDAVILARYGMTQTPALWQPEPLEVRELKALISRLEALKDDIAREDNRMEKALVSVPSKVVQDSIQTVRSELEKERKRLESMIDDHIDRHPGLKQDRALLESIPGVGPTISQNMVALMRSRHFEKASQCAAFLGLNPIERQSGTSVYSPPRLSKQGNGRIRAKLYMAAVVAIRHNPIIRDQYLRLVARGKAKKAALGAAMRKLVHQCYGVLKHQVPYQPQAT